MLSALFSAAGEGLTASIVADMFFVHEHGWWMGLYIFVLQSGTTIGTIATGFMITSKGWRWGFWALLSSTFANFQLTGIVAGVVALAIFFFFAETQYFRTPNAAGMENHESGAIEYGKKQEQGVVYTSSPVETSAKPRKPYIQQLKPWSSINPNTNVRNLIFRPWPLIVYPAGFYAMLLFSLIVGWSVCVINTNASVFQAPPYHMTPGINSVGIKVPSFIGCGMGMYSSGALTDRYVKWRARKNHGIYEPETRLVMLIPTFFVIPAGLLMYFRLVIPG